MKNSITLEIGDQVVANNITYTIIGRKGSTIVIQNEFDHKYSPGEKWFLEWVHQNKYRVIKPKSQNFNSLYEKLCG